MRNTTIPTVIPAMLLTPNELGGPVAGLGVGKEFVRVLFAEGIAAMFF